MVPKIAAYRKRALRDFTSDRFASSTLDSGSMVQYLNAKSWEQRQKEATFTVWACTAPFFICSRLCFPGCSRACLACVGTDVHLSVGLWSLWGPRCRSFLDIRH